MKNNTVWVLTKGFNIKTLASIDFEINYYEHELEEGDYLDNFARADDIERLNFFKAQKANIRKQSHNIEDLFDKIVVIDNVGKVKEVVDAVNRPNLKNDVRPNLFDEVFIGAVCTDKGIMYKAKLEKGKWEVLNG